MFDETTEFGARVARRLRDEQIIWLVTAGKDGVPQPSPVWFLWANQRFLIFSEPDKPKLRLIAQNPTVALHFDGDGQGGNIIVFIGTAEVLAQAPVEEMGPLLDKYGAAIKRLGSTPEKMAQEYSVVFRVTPSRVRGH